MFSLKLSNFINFWDSLNFNRDKVNINHFDLEQEAVNFLSVDKTGVSVSVDGVVFNNVNEVCLLLVNGVLCFSFDLNDYEVSLFILEDVESIVLN